MPADMVIAAVSPDSEVPWLVNLLISHSQGFMSHSRFRERTTDPLCHWVQLQGKRTRTRGCASWFEASISYAFDFTRRNGLRKRRLLLSRKRKGNQRRRVLQNRKRKQSQWSQNLSQWSQNLSQWSQKLSHLLLQKGRLNLMLVMPLSPMKRHQGNDLPSVALLLLLMKDLMQRQRHQDFQAECNGNDRVMTHNYQSCPFIKSNSLPVALCFRQAFSSILVQECKRVGCEVG